LFSVKEFLPNDDGFQSASSSLSEEKSKFALVPADEFDHWSRALTQTENKYFTWEQRGR
jgi:putative SOS response-associated peptidase YedK